MKLDTHVHTWHSGSTSIRPLRRLMRESYNTPERVYATAKARGMDLVVITDHDEISGALSLADRPDVIVGSEVTGVFPDDGVCVHLNVFGLTPETHREIQRLRHDVRTLLPYLSSQNLFVSLNHVASGINGPLTAAHVAALLPWVDGLEVRNGSRLASQNRTAECLAAAAGKVVLGGSDSHTERGIGYTWTEVPEAATAAQFFAGLRAGRAHRRRPARQPVDDVVGHRPLRHQPLRRAEPRGVPRPVSWRGVSLVAFGGLFGLPLVAIALAGGLLHFVHEQRFNRDLLFDLVARPADTLRRVPELAA